MPALLLLAALHAGLVLGLAHAYVAKRRLGIDVVPGVDMIDDARMQRLVDRIL